MMNILALKSGLAFAPYILESLPAAMSGASVARSIKQGGNGFVIRTEETDPPSLMLMHQNRGASLRGADLSHYQATVQFRSERYDVARTSDEVILATVNDAVLLSHPQSEIWLSRKDLEYIAAVFYERSDDPARSHSLPEWLSVSIAAGRLLISDQRTGRWVLLSASQIDELERRSCILVGAIFASSEVPPVIVVKGIEVHLQFAFSLLRALEIFSDEGVVNSFAERTPEFSLTVTSTSEGMAISNGIIRATLTRKETPKWIPILREGLELLNAVQTDRGQIKTVFANGTNGRWVLQWGDEIYLPKGFDWSEAGAGRAGLDNLVWKTTPEYLMVLNRLTGSCIALTDDERGILTATQN